jgi:hypothetical protein
MKNEDQKNGLQRCPLILVVPAFNLVAVLSLDWLDDVGGDSFFRENRQLELSGKSAENSEKLRGDFRERSQAASPAVPITYESLLSKPVGSIMMPQTRGAFEGRRLIGETPL